VLSEQDSLEFLARMTVVQEKLDGANVSIRVADGRLVPENRGKPVSNHPQFDPFKAWVAAHPGLHDLGSLILYGEWLYAEHGTPYDRLPDYFIAYDLYDTTTESFLAARAVQEYCGVLGITATQNLAFDRSPSGLARLAREPSVFSTTALREGLYLRIEEGDTCVERAKLVRHGYQPRTNDEWKSRGIVPNRRRH
jgi:hypothetical protein